MAGLRDDSPGYNEPEPPESRSLWDIPTGEIAALYLPGGDTPTNRRLIRKMKAGERKISAGDLYVLHRLLPGLDLVATVERAYDVEMMRKRRNGCGRRREDELA